MKLTAERAAKEYLFTNYGHLVRVGRPVFQKDQGIYVAKLHSNYPITIRDDRGKKRFLRIITVPYLGQICLQESYEIDLEQTTTREAVNEKLGEFLRFWTRHAEDLIIASSADRIARLPIVPFVLNPIRVIFDQLWLHNGLADADLEISRTTEKSNRYRQYLTLMEDLKLVRFSDGTWIPGDTLSKIQSQTPKISEGRIAVFSLILREKYRSLRQVFDITTLERIIKVENAVYAPEIEERDAVFRDPSSISSDLYRFYDDILNPQEIESTLLQLEDVGIVDSEDNLFAGTEDIRRNAIRLHDSRPSIQSRWLSVYS